MCDWYFQVSIFWANKEIIYIHINIHNHTALARLCSSSLLPPLVATRADISSCVVLEWGDADPHLCAREHER